MDSKYKSFFKTKVLNIPPAYSLTDDNCRYKIMLYFIITPGFIFTVLLGFIAFFEEERALGIVDFSISAVMVVLFLLTRANKFLRILIVIVQAIAMTFFFILFIFGLAKNQSFVWYYTVPIISFFFFGKKNGFLLSILLIALSLLIALLHEYFPVFSFFPEYPEGFLIRFSMSYFALTIVIYIFELTRQQTKRRLETTLAQLKEETIRDGLTNLYNRRHLETVINLLLRQKSEKKQLAFIMADLDFFKQYNDTYGHHAGDEALKTFSGIMLNTLKRKTDYAFRYGGEEFLIILSFCSEKIAEKISAEIISATEESNIPHKNSLYKHLTVSIGIAYFNNCNNLSQEIMIKLADEALYEAKNEGRNCYRVKSCE